MENKQSAQYERQEPLNLYDEYVERINMQREAAIIKIAESRQIDFAESPNRALVEAALIGWFSEVGITPVQPLLTTLSTLPKGNTLPRIDYACGMFSYAKVLKKSTAVIASECLTALEAKFTDQGVLVEALGPYVNFCISDRALTDEVDAILDLSNTYGLSDENAGKVAVVDFSAPNIAKPLGINHLRSTVIGAAVSNLLEATGYAVVRDNHLGDWGTQFGNLIAAHEVFGDGRPFSEYSLTELNRLYAQFSAEIKTNDDLRAKGQEIFARLNNGEPELVAKWWHAYSASMLEFEEIYKRLHITFDTQIGEGYFKDRAKEIIEELATEAPEVIVHDPTEDTYYINGPHPVPLRTSNGYELYAARDLATIEQRRNDFDPDLMVYVVGEEQSTSFEAVFKAANISYLGHKKDGSRIAFEHANFGLLLGQDGKKLSSRKGTSGSLVEVIDEVYTHAFDETTKHNPDMPEDEAQRIAEKLATAAVVWNDLKTDRTSSVKFDIDQMLNLETGTVLDVAYTYSRSLSILSRAEDLLESLATVEPLFTEDAERQLVAAFSNFKDVILKSANERAPHHLVAYMQGLSRLHGKFYESCRVLGNNVPPESQKLRLDLHTAYVRIIDRGFSLLNIEVPARV
jgi:arginyl-tRNA synthetase